MADQPEARIIARQQLDGHTELSVYDPKTGREARTGLKAHGADDADRKVRQIKSAMEAGGNRVTYKEIGL